MVGLPNFLSMTTLRPFGPMVALTAAAMMLTPRSRAARPSSLNMTCFGISRSPPGSLGGIDRAHSSGGRSGSLRWVMTAGLVPGLLDDGEHVLFPQDQVLLVVQLDLRTGVLAEEDLVAGLHVERDLLALVVHLPVAHRDDLALLGLFLRRVRDDDAALLDLLLLLPLDENSVVQRTNLHGQRASRCKMLALAANAALGRVS